MAHLRSRAHRELQALLIDIRRSTKKNQIEFAKELGWQKSVVERIEAGHQIPSYIEAVEWANACGVTPIALAYRYKARLKRNP